MDPHLEEPSCGSDGELLTKLVRALYKVLLFRDPEPAGLRACLRRLQSGCAIESIMLQLLESPEFTRKQSRFVRTYFRRPPAQAQTGRVSKTLQTEATNASSKSVTPSGIGIEPGRDAERLIYVHSHRRSGTHFLLDTIRAWFDVPEGIQAIPNQANFPRVVSNVYRPHQLLKDHEPFPGHKLKQLAPWHFPDQRERGRRLYEAGSHIYIMRNPLHVLRSAYIFDISAAEPRFKVSPDISFFEYITSRSWHPGNRRLSRLQYWITHVKSWYFDERTLVIHYDDLKNDLACVLESISNHIGLPIRQSARNVGATGIATNLTKTFLANGAPPVCWDATTIEAIKSAAQEIIGPRPWRGLERYMDTWLS